MPIRDARDDNRDCSIPGAEARAVDINGPPSAAACLADRVIIFGACRVPPRPPIRIEQSQRLRSDQEKQCLSTPAAAGTATRHVTTWPTQYDDATGLDATAGAYTGFDSDELVRLR